MMRACAVAAMGLRTARQIVAGLVLSLGCLVAVTACGADEISVIDAAVDAAPDFAYVIPVGAGLALDAGQPLEILPARLDATVGQTIQIVNEDDRGHLVGPWFVGGGETVRQTFTSEGEFIGECTVHPSGEIRVIISA